MTNPFVKKAAERREQRDNPFLAKKGKRVRVVWEHLYGESEHTGRIEFDDGDRLKVRNGQGVLLEICRSWSFVKSVTPA